MDHLKISTITSILKLSEDINLDKVYKNVPITDYVKFIEYGVDNPPKGFSKKLLKKSRKNKKKKIFYNQVTLHVYHDDKIMNVKLFNNGKVQITGLKKLDQSLSCMNKLIKYFEDIDIFDNNIQILSNESVMVNSDFDIGYPVNREALHRDIIDMDMYSSFEPCIYPGVNIKYFINTNNDDGICCCENMCNGKGFGHGDGYCKKITIAVFMSGKIIVTGGRNLEHVYTGYQFIKSLMDERKDKYILK